MYLTALLFGAYDIMNLMKYIAGKGSNEGKEQILYIGARGLSLDCEAAAEQIICMQEALRKDQDSRAIHLVISFPESMRNKKLIIQFAKEIAAMLWKDYQVFYGIHGSTDNKHIHLAINTVSYVNGKKWHVNKEEFICFINSIQHVWDCLNSGEPLELDYKNFVC